MSLKKRLLNIKISDVNGNKYVCSIVTEANCLQHLSLLTPLFGCGYWLVFSS